MFKKSVAKRENVKLKIGLSGPSGAGKTYSALQLAYGITGDWSKVAVADTENKSALYYADLGPWHHIPFNPDEIEDGYHPLNWVKLIDWMASDRETEVLVLDSISHEWEGRGGCLEILEKINKGVSGWKTVTPLHNKFMDALRLSDIHIIACMRSKQEYAMEQNEKGKVAPKKLGMKSIQREGADYEFGVVFDIDMNHFAKASKDRTGVFMPRGEFQINQTAGRELVHWATSAVDVYRGTESQKSKLREIAQPLGLGSKELWSLHKLCIDVEMSQIEQKAKDFATVLKRESHEKADA
jgi:hypothetical protein